MLTLFSSQAPHKPHPHPHISFGPSCCFGTISSGDVRSHSFSSSCASSRSESPCFGRDTVGLLYMKLPLTTGSAKESQKVTLLKCRHVVCYQAITSSERKLPKLHLLNSSFLLFRGEILSSCSPPTTNTGPKVLLATNRLNNNITVLKHNSGLLQFGSYFILYYTYQTNC